MKPAAAIETSLNIYGVIYGHLRVKFLIQCDDVCQCTQRWLMTEQQLRS